ncbi:hypothetical protein HPP92_005645 [Vanilla planifolia]|uniref:Uncharacterized protein n=1 Tax=Vanilla planifolia TaxID=51239 RepID=A0A835VFL7_VANPL|nr:hypothetical protein HPP92_005645 [Vanilla planifolia]
MAYEDELFTIGGCGDQINERVSVLGNAGDVFGNSSWIGAACSEIEVETEYPPDLSSGRTLYQHQAPWPPP